MLTFQNALLMKRYRWLRLRQSVFMHHLWFGHRSASQPVSLQHSPMMEHQTPFALPNVNIPKKLIHKYWTVNKHSVTETRPLSLSQINFFRFRFRRRFTTHSSSSNSNRHQPIFHKWTKQKKCRINEEGKWKQQQNSSLLFCSLLLSFVCCFLLCLEKFFSLIFISQTFSSASHSCMKKWFFLLSEG